MVGNILKLVRTYNDISIDCVALKLNLLPEEIKRIETNRNKIFLSSLEKFSEIYQMPISQILVLSDMQKHFSLDDYKILDDIKRYYVCSHDEVISTEKTKKLDRKKL